MSKSSISVWALFGFAAILFGIGVHDNKQRFHQCSSICCVTVMSHQDLFHEVIFFNYYENAWSIEQKLHQNFKKYALMENNRAVKISTIPVCKYDFSFKKVIATTYTPNKTHVLFPLMFL